MPCWTTPQCPYLVRSGRGRHLRHAPGVPRHRRSQVVSEDEPLKWRLSAWFTPMVSWAVNHRSSSSRHMNPKARLSRRCLAPRCSVEVLRPDVFCPSHWNVLPKEFCEALSRAITTGQREDELALVGQAQTLFDDPQVKRLVYAHKMSAGLPVGRRPGKPQD